MAKHNLTQSIVNKARIPDTGERWYQDGQVRHLALRVRANGSKTYLVRFYQDGVQRKHTIGDATDTVDMPLSEARKRATEFNGKLVAAAKAGRRNRAAPRLTLQQLFDENVKELLDTGASDSYVRNWRSQWKHHVPQALKAKIASDVSQKEIDTLLITIAKTSPTTANRVKSILSRMYKRQVRYGEAVGDPTVGAKRFKEPPRTRWLTEAEADALRDVLLADFNGLSVLPTYPSNQLSGVEEYHREQRAMSAAATLLLLYTGCRTGEALQSTWADFSLPLARWVKPAGTVKQGVEHAVPLLSEAVDLLTELKGRAGKNAKPDAWVFHRPGEPGNRLTSLKKYFARARVAAGIDDPRVTPHVLRKSFASRLLQGGVDIPTAQLLTGHRSPITLLRHYAFSGEQQARDALKAIKFGKANLKGP